MMRPESNAWSTTAVVGLVATCSLAIGVTAGVAFSGNSQTTLYAPVAVRPATMQATAPLAPLSAVNEVAMDQVAEVEAPETVEYEMVEPVQIQQQGVSSWAAGLAGLASVAVGAIVYKFKSAQQRVPSVGPLDVYTKGALPATALLAAQPALAMETNSQAPIATALFIFLPTFFLIALHISTRANLDNASGSFDQDYYDRSKAAGKKRTNEAARLRGEGLGMYAESRKQGK